MTTLSKQPPRPRKTRRPPVYPRALQMGALAVVTACAVGSAACDPPWVKSLDGDIGYPYVEGGGGTTAAGGQGGEAGAGGQGEGGSAGHAIGGAGGSGGSGGAVEGGAGGAAAGGSGGAESGGGGGGGGAGG